MVSYGGAVGIFAWVDKGKGLIFLDEWRNWHGASTMWNEVDKKI